MNKTIKIMLILTAMVSIVVVMSNAVWAAQPSTFTGTETSTFDSIGNVIIGMVQALGSIVSVLTLIILGIKYMLGSPDQKADYKTTFLPYVIGAIIVFTASNLAQMIYNFATTVK